MKTLKANSGVTYLGTPVYIVNLDYVNEKGEDLGALISFNTSAVMLIKRINLLKYVKTIDRKSCELSPDLHDKVIEKISRQFVIVEGGMTKITPRKYDDISKDDVIHTVQSSIQAFKDPILPLKQPSRKMSVPHPSMMLPKLHMDFEGAFILSPVSREASEDAESEDRLNELSKRLKNTMGVKSLIWDSYSSKTQDPKDLDK